MATAPQLAFGRNGAATHRRTTRLSAIFLLALVGGCSLLPGKSALMDADEDGYTFDVDCADDDAGIHPGATDMVDDASVDEDCDGADGTDDDGDEVAAVASGGEDCDDQASGVNPGATEVCDEVDNDCDGMIDEDDAADASTWFADQDGDGYGDASTTTTACAQPESYLDTAGDCDDDEGNTSPGGEEVPYNGADDDCDSSTPDDDLDGDGHNSVEAGGDDCDDDDSSTYPGADELCGDGVINDCESDPHTAMEVCGLGGQQNLSEADLKVTGETAGDLAGYDVSGAGDVDGDGLGDLLVGSCEQYGGTKAGLAYLLLGGGVLYGSEGTLSLTNADATLTGEADGDLAGVAVAGSGDIDGDGLDDLLIGAPENDDEGENTGAVYLLMGGGSLSGASGAISLSNADLKLTEGSPGDWTGFAVSGAGDVDGDGLDDLLFGANYEDSGGLAAGAAYLFFGSTVEGVSGTMSLSESALQFIGETADDLAGSSVWGGGDVDGDGLDDLLVSAHTEDTGGTSAGAAYLLLGASISEYTSVIVSLEEADLKLTGEAPSDLAGFSVSGAGDTDGDGLEDLLVGAPYEGTGGTSAGAGYVLLGGGALFGATGSLSLSFADIKLTGEAVYNTAGNAVSGLGDVDADGLSDLMIGACEDDSVGANAGATYLLLGGSALSGVTGTLSLTSSDAKLMGENAGDHAGCALSEAGDVDSDGYSDIFIGASYEGSSSHDAGAAYLVYGGGY